MEHKNMDRLLGKMNWTAEIGRFPKWALRTIEIKDGVLEITAAALRKESLEAHIGKPIRLYLLDDLKGVIRKYEIKYEYHKCRFDPFVELTYHELKEDDDFFIVERLVINDFTLQRV